MYFPAKTLHHIAASQIKHYFSLYLTSLPYSMHKWIKQATGGYVVITK